jgi:histone H2A
MAERAPKKGTRKINRAPLPKGHINFTTYIYKVLKQVHPDTGITAKSMAQLNGLLFYAGKAVAEKAEDFAKTNGRATVSAKNVMAATKIIFPGELAKHAVAEGVKAVTKFNGSKGEKKEAGVIPAARAKRFFKGDNKHQKFVGESAMRLGASAPVMMAAVIEYLAAEILELSGNAARDNKLQRIKVRHLMMAIQSDEELLSLFKRNRIQLIGGGVLPNIKTELLPEKTDGGKKKYKKKATKGGPRKLRPGTKALREVRKYQKMGGCLLFAKEPFGRLIREVAQDYDAELKFTAKSLELIQLYVEAYLVKVMANANELVVYGGKQTISPKEIDLARHLMGDRN